MDRDQATALALVGAGGVAGALCRHAVAVVGPGTFPWGTLIVNVTGAFLLGVLLYEQRFRDVVPERLRLVAGTGFLSSFTTYSTFAAETTTLAPQLAVANIAATYGLGLLAVLAGRAVAGWVT